jgi:uncharacterized protein YndB with AHSA1/START domain
MHGRFATFIAASVLAMLPFGTMAQDRPADRTAERAITVSTTVKASAAEVYRTWTTTEGVIKFFAPGAVVEAKPDGLYEMYMNPFGPASLKGADGMRILGMQENRMLSFTWNAPPSLPEARKQRTTVIVRFHAVNDRETEVRLTHVGWGEGGEWDKAYQYFDRAWPNVLANLKKVFEQGPMDWKPFLERMKAAEKK